MSMKLKTLLSLALGAALVATSAQAAPATPAKPAPVTGAIYDPIEPVNRGIFWFNRQADYFVIRPVAYGYRYITPQAVRTRIGNASDNLYEPVNMLNAFLQGDFTQGMTTFWRFLLNTTVGLGGLHDVAAEAGLQRRTEDFGQTLGAWGLGEGPYLVLPILGPSNLRDTVGMIGDYYAYPPTYYLETDDQIYLALGQGLVKRERLLDPIDDVYESSLDPYASFRSIYTQHRQAQVANRKAGDSAVAVSDE